MGLILAGVNGFLFRFGRIEDETTFTKGNSQLFPKVRRRARRSGSYRLDRLAEPFSSGRVVTDNMSLQIIYGPLNGLIT